MQPRPFGKTSLTLSPIGLGTWAMAGMAYGDSNETESMAAIRSAVDLGINLFDSAPMYGSGHDGTCKEILGSALTQAGQPVFVSTKFGRHLDGGWTDFTASRARKSVESSLQRLQRDRIDVLFLHSPFSEDEVNDDVWGELSKLREEGLVGVVGHSISMFQQTHEWSLRLIQEGKIQAVQVVYSLMNREAEDFINQAAAAGAGVIAREALGNGWLSGAFTADTKFPPNNLNARYGPDEMAERVAYIDELRFLVRGEVASLPQAALRWALDNPNVHVVLTGAKTTAEVQDCAAAASCAPFTPEERQRVDKLYTHPFSAA